MAGIFLYSRIYFIDFLSGPMEFGQTGLKHRPPDDLPKTEKTVFFVRRFFVRIRQWI